MPREPLTLLQESGLEGVDGKPNLLLVGTARRLAKYTLDGSWVLLHSATFCDDGDWITGRYLVAQLAGLCLVGHTRGGFWDMTMQATPLPGATGYTYLTPNDSLIALGVQSAGVLIQSRGFFFVADLVIDGRRDRSAVYWSDFESTSFIPGTESAAGYFSFGGDEIIAAEEMGNSVMFYTNRSIWLASYVGGTLVWTFERIYAGPDVPWYPRGVVNTGDAHVYLTKQTTMRVLLRGERSPREYDWMDKATGAIFHGVPARLLEGMPEDSVDYPRKINRGCMHLVGWYNSVDQYVSFSWADERADLPNWTMHLSFAHRTACLADHGVTAATMTRQALAGDKESLRTFLTRTMGCEAYPDLNEHDPYPVGYPVPPQSPPGSIYNDTEDPSLPPDADSYCTMIAESDNPCLTHCPPCTGPLRLIFASAEDFSIKEWRWNFDRREMVDTVEDAGPWNNVPVPDQGYSAIGPNPVGEATYRIDPYYTLFQTDSFIEGKKHGLTIRSISVDLVAMPIGEDLTEELVPSIALPWPTTGQGAGGFSAGCMSWNIQDVDDFKCGIDEGNPSYVHTGENPEVHLEVEGRYVAYRLYWGGPANIAPIAFTGLTMFGQSANC